MATCLRCRNEWTPRKEHPKRCPSCQNPNWDRPTKRKRQPVESKEPDPMLETYKEETLKRMSATTIADDIVAFDIESRKSRTEELMRKLAQ